MPPRAVIASPISAARRMAELIAATTMSMIDISADGCPELAFDVGRRR